MGIVCFFSGFDGRLGLEGFFLWFFVGVKVKAFLSVCF